MNIAIFCAKSSDLNISDKLNRISSFLHEQLLDSTQISSNSSAKWLKISNEVGRQGDQLRVLSMISSNFIKLLWLYIPSPICESVLMSNTYDYQDLENLNYFIHFYSDLDAWNSNELESSLNSLLRFEEYVSK